MSDSDESYDPDDFSEESYDPDDPDVSSEESYDAEYILYPDPPAWHAQEYIPDTLAYWIWHAPHLG